jgi:hypothetical protein
MTRKFLICDGEAVREACSDELSMHIAARLERDRAAPLRRGEPTPRVEADTERIALEQWCEEVRRGTDEVTEKSKNRPNRNQHSIDLRVYEAHQIE